MKIALVECTYKNLIPEPTGRRLYVDSSCPLKAIILGWEERVKKSKSLKVTPLEFDLAYRVSEAQDQIKGDEDVVQLIARAHLTPLSQGQAA